jgi:hypothetical protein
MSDKRGHGFTSEQGAVLQAFSRAMKREAHVPPKHPDLLWQQMYNHMQRDYSHLRKHLIVERRCHRREPMSLLPNHCSRNAIAPKVNPPFI